ncbi:melatonin receptor type 1B-B-like [Amphiura filiformis]|uniref:melatonin receptor type 1B-B-like n=1 Tax=Amphiura filiformis TaxID=82378 RepID=UPI003B20F6DD
MSAATYVTDVSTTGLSVNETWDFSEYNVTSHPTMPPSTSIYIPYAVVMAVMSCVGVTGNLFIIGAVIVNNKLHKLPNIFIINLAIADLLVTSLVQPFAIVGVLNKEFLFQRPGLCEMLGSVVLTCCGCSIWTIMGIAMNRYIFICHFKRYRDIYNRRTAPFILAYLWLMGFVIDAPNYFGWAGHGYDTKGQVCSYLYYKSYTYTLYVIFLGAVFPMIVVPYCYLRIYLLVRKSSKNLKQNSDVIIFNRRNKDRKTLRVVFTIWAAFMIMWLPFTIYGTFDFHGNWPRGPLMFANLFGFSNSSINSIIYGVMNKDFREGYTKVLKKILFCPRLTVHVGNVSNMSSASASNSLRNQRIELSVISG